MSACGFPWVCDFPRPDLLSGSKCLQKFAFCLGGQGVGTNEKLVVKETYPIAALGSPGAEVTDHRLGGCHYFAANSEFLHATLQCGRLEIKDFGCAVGTVDFACTMAQSAQNMAFFSFS